MVSAHREGLRVIGHAPSNLGFDAMVREHQDVIAHAEEFLYAFFLFNRPPPTTLAEIDSMIGYAASTTAKAGIFALHDELANLVSAGLTPYQALRMATADAAEFVGGADRFGTVIVGRRADLVLLSGNPLADISATRKIAGVMVRGRWLPAERIAAAPR